MGQQRNRRGFKNTLMADKLVEAMGDGKVRLMQPGRETEAALLEVQDKERADKAARRRRIQEEREADGNQAEIDEAARSEDPADKAYTLITDTAKLEKAANGAVAELIRTFKQTASSVERHKRWGGASLAAVDHLGGDPLDAAKKFERFAVSVRKRIEDTLAEANKRPSGMIGRR